MKATVKNTAQNIGKWIGDNKKIILIVLAIVVSIWISVKLAKKALSAVTAWQINNDAESHTGTPVTSTLQFDALVVRILEATRLWGTNETEIYNVLGELRTQADWEALKRTWQESWENANSVAQMHWYIGGVKPTLIGTLYSELNSSELQKCRTILESKGITPDF